MCGALGLGGRSRRLGDDTERARKAVTARIHHAIDHLRRYHPDLAAHLHAAIRTGTACTYAHRSAARGRLFRPLMQGNP